jgi:hypothetical protein
MTISCLRLEGFWRFMQNYRDSPILPSFLPSFLPSTGNALIRNLTSLLLCTHENCCDSFSGEASGSSKPGLPGDAAMERTTVRSRETGRRRRIETEAARRQQFFYIHIVFYLPSHPHIFQKDATYATKAVTRP